MPEKWEKKKENYIEAFFTILFREFLFRFIGRQPNIISNSMYIFFCIFSRDHFRVSHRRVLLWILSSSNGQKARTEIHKMLPWCAVSHCQGYGDSVSRVICFSFFVRALFRNHRAWLRHILLSHGAVFLEYFGSCVPFTWVSCFLDHRFNG